MALGCKLGAYDLPFLVFTAVMSDVPSYALLYVVVIFSLDTFSLCCTTFLDIHARLISVWFPFIECNLSRLG
jgi:hypothetical protein